MDSMEIDVFKAQLVRHLDQRWGFEIEKDLSSPYPLTIKNVVLRGPAGLIGLKNGDEITEIFGTPVHGLTPSDAMQIFESAGDTLVLTIERKACGGVPRNKPGQTTSSPSASFYQPVIMTGGYKKHISCPKTNPFETAYSRTFNQQHLDNIKLNQRLSESQPQQQPPHLQQLDPSPRQPRQIKLQLQTPRPQSPHHQQHITLEHAQIPIETQSINPPIERYQSPDHVTRMDLRLGGSNPNEDEIPQSRSFRVLHSYMNQKDGPAGASGLPLARSASIEKQNRVKVLKAAHYNSPMAIYSTENLLDTFTNQAADVLSSIQPSSSNFQDFGTDL